MADNFDLRKFLAENKVGPYMKSDSKPNTGTKQVVTGKKGGKKSLKENDQDFLQQVRDTLKEIYGEEWISTLNIEQIAPDKVEISTGDNFGEITNLHKLLGLDFNVEVEDENGHSVDPENLEREPDPLEYPAAWKKWNRAKGERDYERPHVTYIVTPKEAMNEVDSDPREVSDDSSMMQEGLSYKAMERMSSLVNQNQILRAVEQLDLIVDDLEQEGFDIEDILKFLFIELRDYYGKAFGKI